MIHEFETLLEVETPLGRGHALFIEAADHDYYWTVVLKETGALVTFQQKQLIVTRNYTMQWRMDNQDMKNILSKLPKDSK